MDEGVVIDRRVPLELLPATADPDAPEVPWVWPEDAVALLLAAEKDADDDDAGTKPASRVTVDVGKT